MSRVHVCPECGLEQCIVDNKDIFASHEDDVTEYEQKEGVTIEKTWWEDGDKLSGKIGAKCTIDIADAFVCMHCGFEKVGETKTVDSYTVECRVDKRERELTTRIAERLSDKAMEKFHAEN